MPLHDQRRKSQQETDFEIELLAIEIKELENSKKNQMIFDKVKEKQQSDLKELRLFKSQFNTNFKEYMWPYGVLTIASGVVIVRSLVFGSLFGLLGGKLAKNVYEKFSK